MHGYLLDTNTCIAWLKNRPEVVERVLAINEGKLWICAPVKAELWYGACKSSRVAQNQASLKTLYDLLPSIPFDDEAAKHCGEIRADLAKAGTPIGPYDLQIAAIARSRDLVAVTHNTREFRRVPDLTVEDWLENVDHKG